MTSRSSPVATSSPFSSSKSNTIEQEQPHISAGAYIRSLIVKQMSSSSSAARSKAQHRHNTMSSSDQQGHEQAALKPQVKKQTRRRVHTSRPYQERLLNMAEARREIVTALRIHRANMRQQSNKYQQEQRQQKQPRLQQPVHQVMFQEQSQAFEGVVPLAVAMSYASSSYNHHLCSSPLANLIAGVPSGNNYSPSSMLAYDLTPLEGEAPAAAIGGLEQLACSLPAQPLGLNLSFQDFGSSLDNGKNSDDPFGVPLIQSSPCPATSSYSAYSSPVTAMAGHGSLALRAAENKYSSADAPAALSQLLDDDGEMLCSIGGGEMQGMELSETAASVAAASAWWTKILESVESGGGGESAGAPQTTGAGDVGMVDDAVAAASLPEWQWLCDGVGVEVEQVVVAGSRSDILETMHVDDDDYSGGDIALPCIDIEGWDDGEWFS